MFGFGKIPSESKPFFDGIVSASSPPPPISGGTLLVLRDGATAVVADPDRDRVYVVDVSNKDLPALRASIALPLRDEPGRLVQDGAGLVHVVLRNAGAVATIDPVAGQVTARRQICAVPRGIAYDPAQDQLHIACAGGELVTLAPTGTAFLRVLTLPQDLRDVIVDGPRLIVSRFRSAEALVLNAAGALVERIRPPEYTNLSVHQGAQFEPAVAWRMVGTPEGGAVMVHQRGMHGTVGRTPGGYGGLSPCDTIVHTSVTRMKSGDRPVAGPAMPGFVLPVDVALSPDGMQLAMVAAGNGHAPSGARRLFITGVNDATAEWEGGCGMDDKHGPSSSPGCTVPGVPARDGTCPAGLKLCGKDCIDPSSLCDMPVILPLVEDLAEVVAMVPDGGVPAPDASSLDGSAVPVRADGGVGTEICTPGPELPPVQEPVAVAFAGPNYVLVQTREPAQLMVVSRLGGKTMTVTLSQEGRADTGHAVFHSNSGGGLACASCHPEGHEDGRVWNFQCEGDRRTQDLGGGIMGTEPFHWSGDLATFPTLVETVFVGRMSGPSLSGDQAMATLKWINSIPSRPALRPAADPQVARGKLLFDSPTEAACATCHTGAALTNNKTVDVGTKAAFQVPSLRGVAWRAPFMHDGCAASLKGRFASNVCDGGDAHGKTSQLTAAQIDDLVAYLESL